MALHKTPMTKPYKNTHVCTPQNFSWTTVPSMLISRISQFFLQWLPKQKLIAWLSSQVSYMTTAVALAECTMMYHNQLECASEGSIYQRLCGPLGQFFHEIYTLTQACHSLQRNLMEVQCQQQPAFQEPEVLWTIKLAQEDPTSTPQKMIHTQMMDLIFQNKKEIKSKLKLNQ